MKKLLLIILSLFFIIACKTSFYHEGTWMASHHVYKDEKGSFPINYVQFLNINGNKMRLIRFKHTLFNTRKIDTIATVEIKRNKITFKEPPEYPLEFRIFEDSLLMFIDHDQIKYLVYRKLPKPAPKIHWNPVGKLYEMKDGKKMISSDYYLNDSILIEYNKDYGVDNHAVWRTEHIEGHTFLVTQSSFGLGAVLIDSISGGNIYMTSFRGKVKKYVYVEQPINNMPELLGTWSLIEGKFEEENDAKIINDDFSKNHIQQLVISQDSITMMNNGKMIKNRWIYNDEERILFLLDENYNETYTIRILDIYGDELTLDINRGEFPELPKRAFYKRKK